MANGRGPANVTSSGKRLSAEQVSTVVYVLYAAYAEDNYKTWHEVVRTKYPEYQFDGPEPFCVRTMVRNYFPEEDSYSDPSDSTITSVAPNTSPHDIALRHTAVVPASLQSS